MIDKVVASADEAVKDIFDGATIIVGGFGLCAASPRTDRRARPAGRRGSDSRLEQLRRRRLGARHPAQGPARSGRWSPRTSARTRSSSGSSSPASSRSSSSRRARSPSACAPAAPASPPSSPRPARARWSPRARRRASFDGREYVLEAGIVGDFALVTAWKGDRLGNLVYRAVGAQLQPDGRDRRPRSRSPRSRSWSSPASSTPTTSTRPRSTSTGCVVAPREKRIERRTVRDGRSAARPRRDRPAAPSRS